MRKLIVIALGIGLLAMVGCKDDPPPKPAPPPAKEEPVVEAEPIHPLMKLRQAYGLPFPPDVEWVRKGANFIEVGTHVPIPELEKYFRSRLVDYEFVSISKHELRIVGLRSTMPRITIKAMAPQVPHSVLYVQQIGALARKDTTLRAKIEKAEPGKKVETKLSGGNSLAPGAVYGQPYTPKPGDPLHQERYRANFGKPFGTWVLN